ncbi:MAG: hypothetical protein WKG06_46270 [Segetibacter sp.]
MSLQPTIKEIAKRLNISVSIVARALHDHASVTKSQLYLLDSLQEKKRGFCSERNNDIFLPHSIQIKALLLSFGNNNFSAVGDYFKK